MGFILATPEACSMATFQGFVVLDTGCTAVRIYFLFVRLFMDSRKTVSRQLPYLLSNHCNVLFQRYKRILVDWTRRMEANMAAGFETSPQCIEEVFHLAKVVCSLW
jgi:hypothetical protein